MSVIKTTRECYGVRVGEPGRCGSDWANIIIHCWENPPPPDSPREMYYGGEIQINSSFGSWANSWNACGSPFKEFLTELDFDYIFTKFMGSALDVFDGNASTKAVFTKIIETRRERQIGREEARAIWEDCELYLDRYSEHEFGDGMQSVARELSQNHPMHAYFADPMEWPRPTRYDYQAKGFWDKLWPEFIGALKAEVTPPVFKYHP
jgi:hypothetical protein